MERPLRELVCNMRFFPASCVEGTAHILQCPLIICVIFLSELFESSHGHDAPRAWCHCFGVGVSFPKRHQRSCCVHKGRVCVSKPIQCENISLAGKIFSSSNTCPIHKALLPKTQSIVALLRIFCCIAA